MKNRVNLKNILYIFLFLLPFISGFVFYNKLPDKMINHWNFKGEPDGYSSKIFSLFGIPAFMIIICIICIIATRLDPKRENVKKSKKILNLVIWFLPVFSNIIQIVIIMSNMNKSIDVGIIIGGLIGLLFIVIGNYLPKCKQNYTIGIRTPWTLSSENVWNKTHRLGGICFFILGILIIIMALSKNQIITNMILILLLIDIIIPIVYSYIEYRKEMK